MPAIFRADRPSVLIAALSGRALAASARAAGYSPLVADLFNDLDTRTLADRSQLVGGSLSRGFSRAGLLATLQSLSAERNPIGVVYGSGFEDRSKLLGDVAQRHDLIGNPPSVVSRVKDPFELADICRRNGISHPDPQHLPGDEGAWLRKRAGASGGSHVVAAKPRRVGGRRRYFQRRVAGTPVSAAFLGDGRDCRVIGFSRQWCDPAPGRPFRYGGVVRPASIAPALAAGMAQAVARLVSESGLRGLNSADFVVRPDGFDLLEINPRPGATLDVLGDAQVKIFQLHVEACAGRLPDAVPPLADAAAAAVVYAPRAISMPPDFAWPDWTADRQSPDQPVPEGAPICTVLANAAEANDAENLVLTRRARLIEMAEGLA